MKMTVNTKTKSMIALAITMLWGTVLVATRDDTHRSATEAGGGGDPSVEMQSLLESLPVYPGATPIDAIGMIGDETVAAYWAPDEPEHVVAFYIGEFARSGWELQQEPRRTLGAAKADGTQIPSVSAVFVSGHIALRVSVMTTTKAPEGYATQVLVSAWPRL